MRIEDNIDGLRVFGSSVREHLLKYFIGGVGSSSVLADGADIIKYFRRRITSRKMLRVIKSGAD